ncbi:type I glyceraldehyde-3-phosphate dehydrogenase [Desulfohalovibrio reitneri]|uniref:type I glyceraldehyde-3-phosphate dehydrogenase n=1 Tax=Desulfohalovibrio reitneri TaxID=1307759 RepID=UPI0004A6E5D4|nr:type I glyceraldehyde-3-phosphate dehydrogenase [Desulfohalovibrio reitneri]
MSKWKIGINGFGRIGRQVLKAMHERWPDELEVVAVNDLFDVNTNAHLLRHDTNYGPAGVEVGSEETTDSLSTGVIRYGDWRVQSYAIRDPREIPWDDMGVDVVIEATGIFRTGPAASAHLEAGASKVIITAPAKEEDLTVVLGVNDADYDPASHHIVSNASCTTNCLAPVIQVVHQAFGVEHGLMCTIHSYTNDQRILDLPHKDLRRARAAGQNIIPTSTGAAKAVALVIPEMEGRIDGYSMRVPTPTVSVVDCALTLSRETDTQGLRRALREASEGPLHGILGYSDEPLVSMDFKGDPRSSIIEEEHTLVKGGKLAKLVAWYDNEWGYSCRVADLAKLMKEKG